MKKLALYLLVVLFAIPVMTEAKVWRVNNNPGVVADFTTLDAAMAGRLTGDTLHLEPSATPYEVSGNILVPNNYVADFVTIIGNGYFLDNSPNPSGNPGLQQNVLQSIIHTASGNINVNQRFKFIGVVFQSPVSLSLFGSNSTSNVYFTSCLFMSTLIASVTNMDHVEFLKNYFASTVTMSPNLLSVFTFENNIVLDNFFIYGVNTADQLTIRNNVFTAQYFCSDAYWANNIFKTSTGTFNRCVLKNNIFGATQFSTGADFELNNQWGVDMSTVFQSTQTNSDKYFQLAPGSPAIGAGVPNGSTAVDCGAFGGPNPYKLSGIPAIPSIYELQVPAIIISGSNMQINIKSRSNN